MKPWKTCRTLPLNRLASNLGILPRKVCRGAPLHDAVVIQTRLERLDVVFPFAPALPVERRRRTIRARLRQEKSDGPGRDLRLRGGSPPRAPGNRLRTFRLLRRTNCRHVETSLLAARSSERAARFFACQRASGGLLPRWQLLLAGLLGFQRALLQQAVFAVADHLLFGVLSDQ